MVEAVWLAILAVYLPALALGSPGWSLASPSNGDVGIQTISLTAMSVVCVGVNLRLAVEMHSWHVLEHLFMWGSIFAIEIFCLIVSYTVYPASLPTSFDWSQLYAVVSHTWSLPAYWLACVLALFLALVPRTIGKAYDTLHEGRAMRRRQRIVISKQKLEYHASQEKMAQSEMSVPSQSVMARYRATSISAPRRTSVESGTGRESSVDTPTQRSKRPSSFAFSNDDRSSHSVLRSFGRTSLNRRPEGLDAATDDPPVSQ